MDPHERILGRIALPVPGDDERTVVNRGALIRRLLLFDEVYLDSIRLTEIPTLVQLFGVKGFERILRSGCLRFRVEAVTIGDAGSLGSGRDHHGYRTGAPLPPFSYAFSGITLVDLDRHIDEWLKDAVSKIPDLGRKGERGLKRTIRESLVTPRPEIAQTAADRLIEHLERDPQVARAAVALKLSERTGRDVVPSDFGLEVQRQGKDVAVATDLGERFSFDDVTAASEVVQRSLLAVGSLHQRLAEMEAFEAITGFREQEAHLFFAHVAFLLRRDDPGEQEARLDRIAELQGLPDVHDAAAKYSLDAKSLLKLRNSDECVEFRRWLRSIDDSTDDELRDRMSSLREQVAQVIHAPATRAIRFVVASTLDLIPGSKLPMKAATTATNAADEFLLDRLISRPGPITFLGRAYESLFRDFNPKRRFGNTDA